MPRNLKRVDPTRPAGWIARSYSGLAATRAARLVSRRVNWKLDPLLLRLTGGRFASTLVFPTALLETTGAKTGASRRNAIIYSHDGDRVIIVASNAGDARHPSWYHNLIAHPDVAVGDNPMRAAVVSDEHEIARLWPLADNVFPAFAQYRAFATAAHRTIPIVVLTARSSPPQ